MLPFPKCPICGEQMVSKEVEEIVRGGGNTAIIQAQAEVCLHCGERLYTPETIARFEGIAARLEKKDTGGFKEIGISYSVSASA
jgi:YgiT-type zinc finger domain-containing protein